MIISFSRRAVVWRRTHLLHSVIQQEQQTSTAICLLLWEQFPTHLLKHSGLGKCCHCQCMSFSCLIWRKNGEVVAYQRQSLKTSFTTWKLIDRPIFLIIGAPAGSALWYIQTFPLGLFPRWALVGEGGAASSSQGMHTGDSHPRSRGSVQAQRSYGWGVVCTHTHSHTTHTHTEPSIIILCSTTSQRSHHIWSAEIHQTLVLRKRLLLSALRPRVCTLFLLCILCRIFTFSFWLHHTACGILVPRTGIEPGSPIVDVWSPNHWTTKEFPGHLNFKGTWGHFAQGCFSVAELCQTVCNPMACRTPGFPVLHHLELAQTQVH